MLNLRLNSRPVNRFVFGRMASACIQFAGHVLEDGLQPLALFRLVNAHQVQVPLMDADHLGLFRLFHKKLDQRLAEFQIGRPLRFVVG